MSERTVSRHVVNRYIPVLIESIPIERVTEIRYLGVLITSDLMWSMMCSSGLKFTTSSLKKNSLLTIL